MLVSPFEPQKKDIFHIKFLNGKITYFVKPPKLKLKVCTLITYSFIHSFIHSFSAAYPVTGCGGGWSLSQHHRAKAGYTLDKSPGLTYRDKQPSTLTFTPTGNFRVTN